MWKCSVYIFELKNDRRKLVVEQKKHDEDSAKYSQIEKDIGLLNKQIAPVQTKYDKALELAGVKMVRQAPSARVGARPIDVQVGGWAGSQKSAGKTEIEQSEKSEVQMLQIQMLEMRKMIEEQALLIKSLTSKS